MLHTMDDIKRFVREYNGRIEGGINWMWAIFTNDADAIKFHELLSREWETRGVYTKGNGNSSPGVRFR